MAKKKADIKSVEILKTPSKDNFRETKGNPNVVLHHNPGGGADILADGLRRDRDSLDSIQEEAFLSLFGKEYPL